ncbi:MAG: hypothetical protein GQE15_34450 [Archangiaceae bacterium]|nr:hypothetical protein [Archangiaceae bacterium]
MRDVDEHVQLDGSVAAYPRNGQVISLIEFLGDGGLLRLPMATDGGGTFVRSVTSSGPRTVEAIRPGQFPILVQSSADEFDISDLLLSGRPGTTLTSQSIPLQLSFAAWEPDDYLHAVSLTAGTMFQIRLSAPTSSTSYSGMGILLPQEGSEITRTDDLQLRQFRPEMSDAGLVYDSLVSAGTALGFSVPGDSISMTLSPTLQTGSVSAPANMSTLVALIGGAVNDCTLQVHESMAGWRPANAPQLLMASLNPSVNTIFPVRYLGSTTAVSSYLCTRVRQSTIPMEDGGIEDGGVPVVSIILSRNLVSLNGGTVVAPQLAIPNAIALDGRSSGLVSSANPVASWAIPTIGTPNSYRVTLLEVRQAPFGFDRVPVAELRTTQLSIRVPSSYLVSGRRYALEVVARTAVSPLRAVDSRIPTNESIAQSPVFIIQ